MTKPGQSQTVNIARTISAVSSVALFLPGILVRPERRAGQTIRVAAGPTAVVNSFRPPGALGSTVDRVLQNATDPFFKPEAIKQVLSAGWGTTSDHKDTELSIEASHWYAKGTGKDPAGKSYSTGDDNPSEMFRPSDAYSLPHRGFVRNQSSEHDGYSRLRKNKGGRIDRPREGELHGI